MTDTSLNMLMSGILFVIDIFFSVSSDELFSSYSDFAVVKTSAAVQETVFS